MNILPVLRARLNHPLNSSHKLRALGRFVTWQIGSRLVPGPVAATFVNDTRLLVYPGMGGATGNIYDGLNEFESMSFVLHSLRPDDLFLDVGANVGSYTVLAGAAVGARVIAFEPVPSTFAHLEDNIRLNNIGLRVEARNAGVAREAGYLGFTANLDTCNHVTGIKGHGNIVVPVTSLDNLNVRPTVIKIDVEGFENEVIAGAERVLSESSLLAVVMELTIGNAYGHDGLKVHEKMLDIGFETFHYDPFNRELRSINKTTDFHGNTIYVRNTGDVLERLRCAPLYCTNGQLI